MKSTPIAARPSPCSSPRTARENRMAANTASAGRRGKLHCDDLHDDRRYVRAAARIKVFCDCSPLVNRCRRSIGPSSLA